MQNCPKHAKFAKFASRENFLEASIQRTPGYSGHFFQQLQVSTIDMFDCITIYISHDKQAVAKSKYWADIYGQRKLWYHHL